MDSKHRMNQLEKTGKHGLSHQDSRGRCHQLSLIRVTYHARRPGWEAGKLPQAQSCVREAKVQTRAGATSHRPAPPPQTMQECRKKRITLNKKGTTQ